MRMPMARAKPTSEEVEIERIHAKLRTAEKICDTIFWCVVTVSATVCVGLIAWAVVRITEKPSWVTIILAILGLGTPPSVLAWRISLRLKTKVEAELPSRGAEDAVPSVPEAEEEGT